MSNEYHLHPSLVFKAVETTMHFKPTLDSLEEKCINCVLGKAICKLSIIQYMLPSPLATWIENYSSMPLRMKSLQRITLPEDEEPDSIQQLEKIQRCRLFLQNIFEETIRELSFQGTYYFLEYVICCENLTNYDNILVKQDNVDLKQVIQLFNKKIANVRGSFRKTLLYLSEMTGPCLERAVINALVETELALMLAEINYKVKIEQNKYRLRQKENATSHLLQKYNEEIEEASHVSLEIENHILLMTGKLQKKFDKWTRKYNEEVESLDIALLQMKSRSEEQTNQYKTLQQQYDMRQEMVEILQAEADIRDAEMERIKAQNKAAIIIQLWWRRILFIRFIKRRINLKKSKSVKSKSDKNIKKGKKKNKSRK